MAVSLSDYIYLGRGRMLTPVNRPSDYYAGLIRTQHAGFVAPTQGPLLNYVARVPLGVVAQITVRRLWL